MRVLVTGATGLIGRHLLEGLLEGGDTVRALVLPETLEQMRYRNQVEVVLGSLADEAVLDRAAEGVEVVYHLAQLSPSRGRLPRDLVETNVNGLEKLLRACGEAGRVRRFVFNSSVAVYGEPLYRRDWPIKEESPLRPIGSQALKSYSWSKITGESLVHQYMRSYDSQYVILRSAICYGAGGNAVENVPPWLPITHPVRGNDGVFSILQLIHVQDLAEMILRAGKIPEAADEIFNLAGGEALSYRDILTSIQQMLFKLDQNRLQQDWPVGKGARALTYDITKAKKMLGFNPRSLTKEDLREMMSVADTAARNSSSVGETANAVAQIYDRYLGTSDIFDEFYGYSDFWNWGYWDERTTTQREACENLVAKLLAFIPEKKGKILDVACGKGATTNYLLNYYQPENVTGINISEKQLQICRRNAPGCTFLLMDATRLEFPDSSFDNIMCVEAACDFDTRETFLKEAHRVLKPGGRLVLTDAIFRPRDWSSAQDVAPRRANYVRNAEAYRRSCLAAGFADVIVQDTTEESWGGFSANLEAFVKEKLFTGAIDRRTCSVVMRRLNQHASTIQFYVFAACTKG